VDAAVCGAVCVAHAQELPMTTTLAQRVVATIWLAFYVLAIVIAITSPLVLRAIEIAA